VAEAWTIRKVIAWIQADLDKRGIESARLEADLIVAHALKQRRIALYLDLDRPLEERELSTIRALLARRRGFEPMAYLTGEREFYGRSFEVNRDVLIPRPDTETLVEETLRQLTARPLPGRLLDLCTGSGAVALSLLCERPGLEAVASDVSRAALSVAARNAARLGVEGRVELREGDLFQVVSGAERFCAVTVNPPYIARAEMATLQPDVRDFEPHLALDAGEDPLSFYKRLTRDAPAHLAPSAPLLVEVGYGQAPAVRDLFEVAGFREVVSVKDLSGIERVVVGLHAG
jgi:release factor glutamine methyltransferase